MQNIKSTQKKSLKTIFQGVRPLSWFLGVCAASFCILISSTYYFLMPTYICIYVFIITIEIVVSLFTVVFVDKKIGITKCVKNKSAILILSAVCSITAIVAFYSHSVLPAGLKEATAVFGGIFLLFGFNFLINTGMSALLNVLKKSTVPEVVLFVSYTMIIIALTCLFLSQSKDILGPYSLGRVLFTSADTGEIRITDGFFNNAVPSLSSINHPFFHIISLPWTVPAKLIGFLLFFIPYSYEVALIAMQAVAFAMITFMLAKMLNLKGLIKYLFFILFVLLPPQMVFVFLIEQYAFSVLWLVVAIYFIVTKNKRCNEIIALSGGGIVLNLFIAPFTYERRRPIIKTFTKDMLKIILKFLTFCILFGRTLVIFGIYYSISAAFIMNVNELNFLRNSYHFSHFLRDVFVFPELESTLGWERYVQSIPTTFSVVGIIILVLTIVSFIFMRKDKFSQICFYWVCFSFVSLGIFGYGAWENGFFLYSPYFGWAYVCLLFGAANKLFGRIKNIGKVIFSVLLIGCIILSVIFSVPIFLNVCLGGV